MKSKKYKVLKSSLDKLEKYQKSHEKRASTLWQDCEEREYNLKYNIMIKVDFTLEEAGGI